MGEVKRYDFAISTLSSIIGAELIVYSGEDLPYVRSEDYDALRAEIADLVATLIEAQKIITHQGWSASEQTAYDTVDAALAKHRGE